MAGESTRVSRCCTVDHLAHTLHHAPRPQKRLESAGYDTEQDMEREEKKLSTAVKRSRRRDQLEDDTTLEPEAPPTFPLVEVPDHELTEEQIKEKRRQRLMKAGYDARMRVKAEKLEERRIEAERIQADEERRANDAEGWAAEKRREYEVSSGRRTLHG